MSTPQLWRIVALCAAIAGCLGLAVVSCPAGRSGGSTHHLANPRPGPTPGKTTGMKGKGKRPVGGLLREAPDGGVSSDDPQPMDVTVDPMKPTPRPRPRKRVEPRNSKGMLGHMHLEGDD